MFANILYRLKDFDDINIIREEYRFQNTIEMLKKYLNVGHEQFYLRMSFFFFPRHYRQVDKAHILLFLRLNV